MKKLISLGTAALTLLAFTPVQAGVSVGKTAPDFTLTDTNGKEHSLSSFEGKYVVLEWLNYQCPFVVKHYKPQNIQSLQRKYTGKDVVWLSIASTNPDHRDYRTAAQLNEMAGDRNASPTAILMDADGKVGRLYGAKTTPHMFIVGPDGNLVYQGAIDSVRSTDPDDITGAKNYVSQALEAALAGQPIPTATTPPYGCSVKYKK